MEEVVVRHDAGNWQEDFRTLKADLDNTAGSSQEDRCKLIQTIQRGCTMFQGYLQGASEEELRTVAVIFRLSCKVLTARTPAEGQSSSTHSLISGVATLLESAWGGTWSKDMTAVLNEGFTALASGVLALKKLVAGGHVQHDQANAVLQACGSCLRAAHKALFCPRWLSAAGSETFQKQALHMRTALKESMGPFFAGLVQLCSPAGGLDKPADIDESLSSAFRELLQIGTTASDVISGKSDLAKHTEFRSFATLNVACNSLSESARALGSLEERSLPLSEASVGALLKMLCSSTYSSFRDFAASPDAVQMKVLKFWVQHVTRVMGSNAAVTRRHWQPVAEMLASCLVKLPPWETGCRDKCQKRLLADATAVLGKASAAFYSLMQGCSEFQDALTWAAAGASEQSLQRSAFLLEMLCKAAEPERQYTSDVQRAGCCIVPAIVRSMGMYLPSPDAWQALVKHCMEALRRLYKTRNDAADEHLRGCWNRCQAWLFTQATQSTPLQGYLLSDIWACLISGVDAGTAAEHIRLLHKACLSVACLDAQDAQRGCPSDPPLREQLHRLTVVLLRSVHPELMTALCSSIIQEALTLHSSAPLAADSMAGLAAAADTVAAVVVAGVRPDQRGHMLSIDAYERPALECLRVLCGQVCSAAAAGGEEAAVEAPARCLCSVLRMCAELRYDVSDKAAQQVSEAITAVLCCPARAAWAPALTTADILYRHHPADLEATLTAFAQDLASKPTARLGCAALLRHAAGFTTKPLQLIEEMLKDEHWAVHHEAMRSFVDYARSPSSDNFTEVIPKDLLPDGSNSGGEPGSPFLRLMVRYMHSTNHPDPDCQAAAKQHQCSQWVTGEAARALEQGACNRTAQLENLAKRANALTKEPMLAGAAGNDVMRIRGTAREALAALCSDVRAQDGGGLTSELRSQLDEMACMIRTITASAG